MGDNIPSKIREPLVYLGGVSESTGRQKLLTCFINCDIFDACNARCLLPYSVALLIRHMLTLLRIYLQVPTYYKTLNECATSSYDGFGLH